MTIIGRTHEQKQLQKALQSNQAEFIAIYGRRRVGKTELVKQFLKNIKNHFYFYVEVAQKSEILNYLSKSVEEQLGEKLAFKDFYEFLSYIGGKADKEPFVLVIDEFQRFLDIAPEYISSLQNAWDSKLKHKKIKLIICGSAASWIIDNVLHARGGLHNRVTLRLPMEPFTLAETKA